MELYIGGVLNLPDSYFRKYIGTEQSANDVEKLLMEIVDETRKEIKKNLTECFNSLYEGDSDSKWEPPKKEELLLMIQEL